MTHSKENPQCIFAGTKLKAPMLYQVLNMGAEGKSARSAPVGSQFNRFRRSTASLRVRQAGEACHNMLQMTTFTHRLRAQHCKPRILNRMALDCTRQRACGVIQGRLNPSILLSCSGYNSLTCVPVGCFLSHRQGRRNTTAECISSLASPSQRLN